MLRARKIVRPLLFLELLLAAWPATAQYLTKLEIDREQQVVFCDAPASVFEELVFSELITRHENLFYSTVKNGTPVLEGKGGTFFEAISTIFVMDQATAVAGGCLPINKQQAERLKFEVGAQLRVERDVAPLGADFRRAVENSWCQPVFDIPISKSNNAIVFRLNAPPDHDMSTCVAHFNDHIILEE